jgi:molybdate transport system ATP-binding protein
VTQHLAVPQREASEPGRPGGDLSLEVTLRRGGFTLDAAMRIASGEVLAVIGPNGAGKSTVLRAVAGLLAACAGQVRLGDDVWDDPGRGVFVPAVDRSVGIVFQDYRLFPHLSVLDSVRFAQRASPALLAPPPATAKGLRAHF